MMQCVPQIVLLVLTIATVQPVTAVRHIVFIVADDLGWNDVGFHNPDMITPNIDKLATGGVILNSSYVQPTCTPSRHAFMTGNYPFKAGIQRGALIPEQAQCSPLGVRFLPERLKSLNYATHIVGKWHLGFCNWSCTPTYRGFDSFLGYYNGKEDYYTKEILDGVDFRDDRLPVNTETYSAEVFTARAVDIINKHNKGTPLFLYLPYQSVHAPVQVPQRYEDMYPNIQNDQRRQYCGMVSALDEGIGNVTETLQKAGLMDDTLIIFTTDNGGMPIKGGNNFPLRGAKATIYEGGTRASAFVYGAGIKKKSYTYDGLFHAVDWNPTIIAAAGGQIPAELDGFNQWEAITTGSKSSRTEFIYNLDPAVLAVTGHAAIRVGDFKFVQGFPGPFPGWYEPPKINKDDDDDCIGIEEYYDVTNKTTIKQFEQFEQLFNLRKDPTEHNDLSKEFPDIVKQMRAKLDEYRKEMVDPPSVVPDPASDPVNWGGYWSPGWC